MVIMTIVMILVCTVCMPTAAPIMSAILSNIMKISISTILLKLITKFGAGIPPAFTLIFAPFVVLLLL